MSNHDKYQTPTLSDLHNLNRRARNERSAAFYTMMRSVGEWFGNSEENQSANKR
ncbi:MAG: hypothetical protein AAF141_00135 [Pseudomonadota bacterium]